MRIGEVRYLTDDRDDPKPRNELSIFRGGNGDWYVGVSPEGAMGLGQFVRICTSGGAASSCPALVQAVSDAYVALAAQAEAGCSIPDPQMTAPAEEALYRALVASHPALQRGLVRCLHCGAVCVVDVAKCFREGWPLCCEHTMTLVTK